MIGISNYHIKAREGSRNYIESLDVYCERLQKRNMTVLFQLENYLGKMLTTDEELAKIRGIILSVSGEIKRIPNNLVGDDNEH